MDKQKTDYIGAIIEYEQGELSPDCTLDLFSELIKTGQAWKLQGHYGRTAEHLIQKGFITRDGQITKQGREAIK